MARRVEFTCDGCGDAKFVKSGDMPGDWTRVTVTFDGFRLQYPSLSSYNNSWPFDLCAGCQNQLVSNALPSRWAKPRPQLINDDDGAVHASIAKAEG